tara:strand:- start:64 stop:417 length:354 start_codon:yes stop_codon:yes gene_type:complete
MVIKELRIEPVSSMENTSPYSGSRIEVEYRPGVGSIQTHLADFRYVLCLRVTNPLNRNELVDALNFLPKVSGIWRGVVVALCALVRSTLSTADSNNSISYKDRRSGISKYKPGYKNW